MANRKNGGEQSGEVSFPGIFLTLQAEGEENHETQCRCSGRGSNRMPLEYKSCYFLHGCTVHVDNIKFFICPTNAHTDY